METPRQITVLVVDDHAFFREGVRAVIDSQPDMKVVGEAQTGDEALTLFRRDTPKIVLMDLQMPGMSGIAATAAILRQAADAKIIVLTTYAGDAQALRALRAGAAGYLLKGSLRKELIDAVRTVHAGGRHLTAAVAKSIALHALDGALSEREIEVLTLAAQGRSNKEIGRALQLSDETVKGFMRGAFAKLGASDRTHAVTIATRRGIIEP